MRLLPPIGQMQQQSQFPSYFGGTQPVNQAPAPAFPAAYIPSQFQPSFPSGQMPSKFNPPAFVPATSTTQQTQQNQMQWSNFPTQSRFAPTPSTFNPGPAPNNQTGQLTTKPPIPGSQPSTFHAPTMPNLVPFSTNSNIKSPPQTGEVFRQLMGTSNTNTPSQFNSGSASRFPSPSRNQGTIQNGPDFRQLMNGGPVYPQTNSGQLPGNGRFPSPVHTPSYMQPDALPPAYSHNNSSTNSSNGGQHTYVQKVNSTTNLRLQPQDTNVGGQAAKPSSSISMDNSPSAFNSSSGFSRNAWRKTADWLPAELEELRNMAATTKAEPQEMSFKQKLAKFQALVGND